MKMEARAGEPKADGLRIGALARASGYSDKALRYYEQIGLLRPNAHTSAGYRVYAHDAVERLRFVKNAQSLGLSLNDIQQILDITDSGRVPCEHMLSVVDRELAQIAAQLHRLQALRGELSGLRKKLSLEISRGTTGTGQGCRCVGRIEK
jgi:DNA-binding transcriptional MerR regulator